MSVTQKLTWRLICVSKHNIRLWQRSPAGSADPAVVSLQQRVQANIDKSITEDHRLADLCRAPEKLEDAGDIGRAAAA